MTDAELERLDAICAAAQLFPRNYVSFSHLPERLEWIQSVPRVTFRDSNRTWSAELVVTRAETFASVDFKYRRNGKPTTRSSLMFAAKRARITSQLQQTNFRYLAKLHEIHDYNTVSVAE